MSSTPPPRVAIIGTGFIGGVHRRAARNAGAEVAGVLGSSDARSRDAAAQWGVARGYRDLQELLADRPDVVQICTPNASHLSLARAVVDAGVHVVCEKPLATRLDDARALAAAATDAGVVATVPFVYRYHPLVREIRARRLAGDLGRVLLVHGSYLQDWLMNAQSTSWRVEAGAGGASRAFADIGSHWCDLAEYVTGEHFTSLSAITSVVHPTRPVPSGHAFTGSGSTEERIEVATEDTAIVALSTAGGVTASTVISQVSGGRKNRLWIEVDGSLASAVFDQERPDLAWFGSETGTTVLRRGEGVPAAEQGRMNLLPAGHSQGYLDAFTAFLDDTYAATRGEVRDGLPTFHDGARSAALVEAVLRSAASRTWVDIPPALGA